VVCLSFELQPLRSNLAWTCSAHSRISLPVRGVHRRSWETPHSIATQSLQSFLTASRRYDLPVPKKNAETPKHLRPEAQLGLGLQVR
jgi:hypothetical protein